MKTTAKLAALAVLLGTFTAGTITIAEAAIKNRAECYTAVTNACNKKKSSEAITACNDSGHSQCDKQFPNMGGTDPEGGMTTGTMTLKTN